jgi:AraC family transcriptional regulator
MYLKEGYKYMDYRIIQRDAFKVIGKVIKLSTNCGEHNMGIAKFWGECNVDGTTEEISSIDRGQNLLGICLEFEGEKEELTYMIGIEDVNNSSETGFETREIPSATWAVFTSVGPMPHAIIDVWTRIFQEWFPETGYEHANAPDFELYFPGDTSAEDYKSEVWVPIVKK